MLRSGIPACSLQDRTVKYDNPLVIDSIKRIQHTSTSAPKTHTSFYVVVLWHFTATPTPITDFRMTYDITRLIFYRRLLVTMKIQMAGFTESYIAFVGILPS